MRSDVIYVTTFVNKVCSSNFCNKMQKIVLLLFGLCVPVISESPLHALVTRATTRTDFLSLVSAVDVLESKLVVNNR